MKDKSVSKILHTKELEYFDSPIESYCQRLENEVQHVIKGEKGIKFQL